MISNDLFNGHTGLCIICPVTNTRRDYPFHVAIPDDHDVSGVVMVRPRRSQGSRCI